MEKGEEKPHDPGGEGSVSRLCRCGRAPKRPSQRNCRLCHAEANRRYRASLKKQSEALKRMRKLVVS
jgi:hypothetical protein